jgi:hypothetical protein
MSNARQPAVQQIDVRNEQTRLLPLQYTLMKVQNKTDLPIAAAQYIRCDEFVMTAKSGIVYPTTSILQFLQLGMAHSERRDYWLHIWYIFAGQL